MTVRRMIVVIRSIQIGRHDRNIIRTVLMVQKLTVLKPGNLGKCIGLIGLFELTCQKTVLLHRLRRHARIDTGRTKELQLLTSVFPCRMDNIHFQRHVIVHEICQCFLICNNTSDLCSSKKDIIRLFLCKKRFHRILTNQIKLLMCASNNIRISLSFKFTDNRRTYHSTMTCNIDFCIFFHHYHLPSFL